MKTRLTFWFPGSKASATVDDETAMFIVDTLRRVWSTGNNCCITVTDLINEAPMYLNAAAVLSVTSKAVDDGQRPGVSS